MSNIKIMLSNETFYFIPVLLLSNVKTSPFTSEVLVNGQTDFTTTSKKRRELKEFNQDNFQEKGNIML